MGAIQQMMATLGKPKLSTLSSFSTTTSTAATIAWPASIQAGDVAVLMDRLGNAFSNPTVVTPSGFTQIVSDVAFQAAQSIFYKVLDGSETGNITGGAGDNTTAKILQILRGNVPIVTVTANDVESSAIIAGNPASQTCTASAGSSPLVIYAGYSSASGNVIDPRTFSPAKDAEINVSTNVYLAYKIYNSSPANTTIDMDDEGNNNCLHSFYLTFT